MCCGCRRSSVKVMILARSRTCGNAAPMLLCAAITSEMQRAKWSIHGIGSRNVNENNAMCTDESTLLCEHQTFITLIPRDTNCLHGSRSENSRGFAAHTVARREIVANCRAACSRQDQGSLAEGS